MNASTISLVSLSVVLVALGAFFFRSRTIRKKAEEHAREVVLVWARFGPFENGAASALAMRFASIVVLEIDDSYDTQPHAEAYNRDPSAWDKVRQEALASSSGNTERLFAEAKRIKATSQRSPSNESDPVTLNADSNLYNIMNRDAYCFVMVDIMLHAARAPKNKASVIAITDMLASFHNLSEAADIVAQDDVERITTRALNLANTLLGPSSPESIAANFQNFFDASKVDKIPDGQQDPYCRLLAKLRLKATNEPTDENSIASIANMLSEFRDRCDAMPPSRRKEMYGSLEKEYGVGE